MPEPFFSKHDEKNFRIVYGIGGHEHEYVINVWHGYEHHSHEAYLAHHLLEEFLVRNNFDHALSRGSRVEIYMPFTYEDMDHLRKLLRSFVKENQSLIKGKEGRL